MIDTPRRFRTMSIGGATFDLFVSADDSAMANHQKNDAFVVPFGSKIRVKGIVGAFGGGACNTSVGLSRLGCEASFCGITADDQWGHSIIENLKKENVDTSHATIIEGESASFSIILSSTEGERIILNHPGTSKHLHDVTFAREAAKTMDWIYLNSIQEESCAIEDDIIKVLAETPHAKLTWNPGECQVNMGYKRSGIQKLLKNTTLLQMNKEEALVFTSADTVEEALRILAGSGTTYVCITDGKNGTLATDGVHVYHCPIVDCAVVDTTGAGDAFGTAATWALMQGKDLPTALRAGTINAMSVVGVVGAEPGLLTETQIQSRLASTHIDVSVREF